MVTIITDTASDMDAEDYERLNIVPLPLSVTFGDKTYLETKELTKDVFYDKLLNTSDFPTTSQPTPEDFSRVFSEATKDGGEAVYISISSRLSGTCSTAKFVKEDGNFDRVYIVDSKIATGGQKILAEHAAKLRDHGKCAADIADELEYVVSHMKLYACLDTLKYLAKGGRLSHGTAFMGNLLDIKPVITFIGSELSVVGKPFGMKNGMNLILSMMKKHVPDMHFPIYTLFTYDSTNACGLIDLLHDVGGFAVDRSSLLNVGAAIGTHIGPYACGIVYVEE